jgi:demethylmenaquinone methyltransferase/2-methoxy-6-polyprenyl-1,4-benzoquinol methylase
MCGMGETWAALERRFPGTDLVALDFSSRMVARARARSAVRHGGKVAVVRDDMLVSGLSDGAVDVLVSAYGLKTFSRIQTELFVEELARILKPGGHFALIEVTEPPHRILRALYRFYVRVVVPCLARLLVAETEEYRMLAQYLQAYRDGERTAVALAGHPLLTVEIRRYFFGCATSFSGRRVLA